MDICSSAETWICVASPQGELHRHRSAQLRLESQSRPDARLGSIQPAMVPTAILGDTLGKNRSWHGLDCVSSRAFRFGLDEDFTYRFVELIVAWDAEKRDEAVTHEFVSEVLQDRVDHLFKIIIKHRHSFPRT